MAKRVNVYTDYRFQVDLLTPNADGDLAAPTLGAITGIVMRLAATKTAAAIHAAVDNLSATEVASVPGRFYVTVDTGLLVTHVLPLGVGQSFYAIWKKSGDMDREAIRFVIGDGNVV